MSLVSKLLSMGIAVWFALAQIMFGMSAAYAQSDIIDVEPPLIEHNIVSTVEAASRQSFFATVVDDGELDGVSLFYRFQGDPDYSSVLMNRVSFSSTYTAEIPTDAESDRNIEYYIQAQDKAGNRTVRGYAFNPLLREVNATNATTEPVPQTESPGLFESGSKKRTVLYVVLGVLAVGAIAASVDWGGDDPPSCPNNACSVTVTVEGRPIP